jgi:hypothetical protein
MENSNLRNGDLQGGGSTTLVRFSFYILHSTFSIPIFIGVLADEFRRPRARQILMPAGGNRLMARYQEAGVETVEVAVDELIKADGGIHCMTAFLRREEV